LNNYCIGQYFFWNSTSEFIGSSVINKTTTSLLVFAVVLFKFSGSDIWLYLSVETSRK